MSGLFSGPKKVKESGDFKMTGQTKDAERLLLNQLTNQIQGNGESLANTQYEKAMQDALKSNLALASSARGVTNPGLLARNVANANAEMTNNMAQNSAMLRLSEQNQAQDLLAKSIASQRGVALQSGIANQQADQNYRQQNMSLIGNLGAGAAALSDENLKTNKKKNGKSALKAVEEFLNSVEPYEYNYKGGDDVDRHGIMAQDLEKSQIGKQMVVDTPDGKAVDYGQGFNAMMAGLAEMNKRLKKVEKKKVA